MVIVALILAIWIALGMVVIGVLNLAKWAIRSAQRRHHVVADNVHPWPAPQPTSNLESTTPTPMRSTS